MKQKIVALLRPLFPGKTDDIVVLDGFQGLFHLYVVSRKFRGKRPREARDMIWPILLRSLTEEEWGRITLVWGLTREEISEPLCPELYHYLSRR